jgi:hypothetical protein
MPRDYGPAGKWVHDRAHRIMREGDTADQYGGKKGKSVAYAIAVQQAHKLGKSPKGFRTPGGVREAKSKFDLPKKEYQKTAEIKLAAFFDELERIKEAQGPPEEATARGRAAASESAAQSVRNLVTTGGIGEGRASGTGSEATAGPSPTMTGTGGASGSIGPTMGPPMPAGGTGETGGGLDIPSANIGSVPGGSPLGGGGGLGAIPGGSPLASGGGFSGGTAPVRGLGAGGASPIGETQGRMGL